MNAKQLFLYALETASEVISRVEPDTMELPTPDSEWSVHDLLQHIVYELAWTSDIVAGKTIQAVGDTYENELRGTDPVESWKHYEPLARRTVVTCDEKATAHLSYTDVTVEGYLLEASNDQLIHAWDLGQSIGVPVVFDDSAVTILLKLAESRAHELAGSGLFAPPLSVPESADAQTKLLAILGRSAGWKGHS